MSQPETDMPLVLVADDDADIRELVRYRLERSGYEVATAVDGEQAERLALERLPALCVFDVMMPKLDGYELTRRLRARGETRAMPIILLTARACYVRARPMPRASSTMPVRARAAAARENGGRRFESVLLR